MARSVVPDEKYPGETVSQSVDFTALLDGDTVSTGSIVVHDRGGVDRTSAMLSGSVTNTTSTVDYTLTGGTAGEIYTVTVLATLSSGDIRGQRVRIKVTPPG